MCSHCSFGKGGKITACFALIWALFARFKGNKIPQNRSAVKIHNLYRDTFRAQSCKYLRIGLTLFIVKNPIWSQCNYCYSCAQTVCGIRPYFFNLSVAKVPKGSFQFLCVCSTFFHSSTAGNTHTSIPHAPSPREVVSSPIGVNHSCAGVRTYVDENHAEMSWLCENWLAAIEAIISPNGGFPSLTRTLKEEAGKTC